MKTQKLNRLLMLLVAFMTLCVTQVWGASIEINTTNSGVTGSYADKTFDVDDVTFGFTQWMKSTNIQAKKSTTNSCYNVDAIPGNIKKITVVQTGTARAIKIYGGTSSKPTTEITAPSTAATMEFDFTGKNYTYFSMTTPGNAVYMNTITIEYETSGGTSPTITKSGTLTAFTATYGSASAEQRFTVGGSNLTANISVSAPTNYEISKTSGTGFGSSVTLTKDGSGNVANTTLYIRLKNNVDAGSVAAADITCTSGSANQTISIPASKVQSKVNWSVNGSTAAGSPTGAVDKGGKVSTLPTAPTSSDCDGSKVFVGWTDAAIASPTNTKPSTLFTAASGAPTVNVNEVTYYAVFANAAIGTNYTQITAANALEAGGRYLIVGNSSSTYKALPVDKAETLTTVTPSSSKISNPAEELIWTLEGSTGAWKIKSVSNGKYLQISGGNLTFESSTSLTFNASVSSSKFTFTSSASSGSKVLSYYSSQSKFNAYTTANNVYLYKADVVYSNYTTTCGPATYTASVAGGLENGSII